MSHHCTRKECCVGPDIEFQQMGRAHLASPSLHMLNNIAQINLSSGSFSFPYLVANVCKERFPDIHKALYLCPDIIYDRYHALLPFLQASMTPWRHRSYPIIKKEYVLFPRLMVWLFRFVAIFNDLDLASERKKSCKKPREVLITVADGVQGSEKGWAKPHWVRDLV